MMKQSLLFVYREQGNAGNLDAKLCFVFTQQKAQRAGKAAVYQF